MDMKIALDLCSGGHGWTSGLDPKKWIVISVELETDYPATIHGDITDSDMFDRIEAELKKHGRHYPDLILFSPPCKSFSIAGCWKHWTAPPERKPKTEAAVKALEIVHAGLEIINKFCDKPKEYGTVGWVMENPRGLMRKMGCVEKKVFSMGGAMHTVTYCQYGHTNQKPTDLWTNIHRWKPRPMCRRGEPCHASAPRGSNLGTQLPGMTYLERSLVPQELSEEVGTAYLKPNTDNEWM